MFFAWFILQALPLAHAGSLRSRLNNGVAKTPPMGYLFSFPGRRNMLTFEILTAGIRTTITHAAPTNQLSTPTQKPSSIWGSPIWDTAMSQPTAAGQFPIDYPMARSHGTKHSSRPGSPLWGSTSMTWVCCSESTKTRAFAHAKLISNKREVSVRYTNLCSTWTRANRNRPREPGCGHFCRVGY